ncbi:hypothetical protein G7054_g12971 [Neopestalotiopsis clavispora]|nr:hypothetical protein G7054_g12971 [Neopestalotiopsis clavispora]
MATIFIPTLAETTPTTTSVSTPDTTSEGTTAADPTTTSVSTPDTTSETTTSAAPTTTSAHPTITTSLTTTSPTTTRTAIITQISLGSGSGSITSWSPLTTTFIPATSCFNRYYQVNPSSDAAVITSGTLDPTFNECQLDGSPDLTYSPGMCPGRMTTAVRTSSDGHFTELCCQSGFSYDPRGCGSIVEGATIVSIFPTSGGTQLFATITSVVAVHEAVTIIWASSDLSLFPSDVAANRSALFTSSNANSNADVGLTQAAKIGIGVGVALGVTIILIIISAWLLRVRRKRKRFDGQARNGVGELDGEQKIWKRFFGREWRAELPPDGQPSELETKSGKPTELAVPQIPVELPGSYHYPKPAAEADEGTEARGEYIR